MPPKPWASIETRISEVVLEVINAWRRRGLAGDVMFGGRYMPARLTLGVLSLELVVHGWDFAQALRWPLPISPAHADYVLGLAQQIVTPQSRLSAGFDDPVPVAEEADAIDRLVAFTGRSPRWPHAGATTMPCAARSSQLTDP